MKKCVIITSYIEGILPDLMEDYDPDLILCADGGYDHARRAGITPDYLIGDFDSLKCDISEDIRQITYPCEKDDTDTGLCIQTALDMGCNDILILGGLGGRLDHSVANIQLLAGYADKNIRIAIKDKKNFCTVLHNGEIHLKRKSGQHVSILSLSDTSSGVSVSGLKYPLTNAVLKNTFPLGVSNEYTDETAWICVKDGTLLIVLSED